MVSYIFRGAPDCKTIEAKCAQRKSRRGEGETEIPNGPLATELS